MENVIYCTKCGNQCSTSDKFCAACGNSLEPKPAEAAAPAAKPETPEKPKYAKADNGRRFLAFLIDWIIASLPFLIFWVILIFSSMSTIAASGAFNMNPFDFVGTMAFLPIFLIILVLAAFAFSVFYTLFKDGFGKGQSIGKRIMRLRVINLKTQQPCNAGTSCLRNIISVLIGALPMIGWLVDPVMVLATDDGRKLGDMAADTQVINA